ncbi:outer membrane protein V [Herbaspirillum sp. CF444]|nr:outer membrane protein V [Herbaspirillum sp. CF444]
MVSCLTIGSAHADDNAVEPALGVNPPLSNSWRYSLMAGVANMPKYAGSSDQKFKAIGGFSATYGRYFIGAVDGGSTPFGVGAYFYNDEHWRVGAALSYDLSSARKESDDETRLRGLGDIEKTAHATLFASYTRDWFGLRTVLSTDAGGKHQGTTVNVDLDGKYQPIEHLVLSAGPGLTWNSSQYNQTFYGITSQQSARSGLSAYSPRSGVTLRVSVGANYQLNRNWNIGTRVGISRLPSEVANSPIVNNRNQVNYGISANYKFD